MNDFSIKRRSLLIGSGALLAPSWLLADPALQVASEALFLDDIERRTFNFFWETTDPKTGLVPDRWPTPSFCSIAAVGFGLTAYTVGVQRGFVSRSQALERTLTTLQFFRDAPQGPEASGKAGHRGFFYHFLDMGTGARFRDCELSTIDTALLLAGMLSAQAFFDGADARETKVRDLVDTIYARVDWAWASPRAPLVGHGWSPEKGMFDHDWRAYDESQILYLLALGSPGKALGPEAYKAWASGLKSAWGEAYGLQFCRFGPLFGHQFTQVWADLRGLQDDFMREKKLDYFENSRRATQAQRTYAMVNPMGWKGYGDKLWGVTASDGPADLQREVDGRKRRFISYAGRGVNGEYGPIDDGTLAPYGAGASIAFTPEISIPALMEMKSRFGDHLYQRYGFLDSFNPSFDFPGATSRNGKVVPGQGWFNKDYLGIDQGPMLAMLGNHRGELVWKHMRKSAHLRKGLEKAGFKGGWLG